jgi:hypothetical protein
MTVPELLAEIGERAQRPTLSVQHVTVLRLLAEVLVPTFGIVEMKKGGHAAAVDFQRAEVRRACEVCDRLRMVTP